MIFYETSVFTEQVTKLISDESYAEFQQVLITDPEAGDIIQRSRGLRKILGGYQVRARAEGYASFIILSAPRRYFFSMRIQKAKAKI